MSGTNRALSEYGRLWIELINRLGGNHHGYFLPSQEDKAKAAFDRPTNTKIHIHVHIDHKGDYYDIADGLPQFQPCRIKDVTETFRFS